MSTSISGLSNLIDTYKAEPEETGNTLARFLIKLLTHGAVKNKIVAAAGPEAHHISMSLNHLVEEVRQDAIATCLTKFRNPDFSVLTDAQSAKYVFNAVKHAAHALVDRHLGSKRADGKGRSKGLSNFPFKWHTEEEDPTGYAAVTSAEADVVNSDPALVLVQSQIGAYLDSIQHSNEKLHLCMTLYLDGFTQTEIAAVIGVDERTIRNYFQKAKSAIANSQDF